MKLTMMILALSLSALASSQSPIQCKSGFTEVTRCKAVAATSIPQPTNRIAELLAEASLSLYQDIVVCKNGTAAYVQTNITNNNRANLSPEIRARISNLGLNRRVIFDTEDNSSSSITYDRRIRAAGNAELVVDYRTDRAVGKKIDRFVYSAQCD